MQIVPIREMDPDDCENAMYEAKAVLKALEDEKAGRIKDGDTVIASLQKDYSIKK